VISARSGHPGTSQRTVCAAIVCALAALVMGGCGGGGGEKDNARLEAAYETKLKTEGSRLKTAFSAADIGEAENFEALAKALEHLQLQLRRTAAALATLDAPKDAVADDTKLAALYRKAAAKVGQQVKAAKADDERRLVELNEQADDIMAEARAFTGDLKSKGYEVGVLGER
jgi:hypothetical protein